MKRELKSARVKTGAEKYLDELTDEVTQGKINIDWLAINPDGIEIHLDE